MGRTHSHQTLRVIHCPKNNCQTLFCWINGRLPTYCPVCGQNIYCEIKNDPSSIMFTDADAVLSYDDKGNIPDFLKDTRMINVGDKASGDIIVPVHCVVSFLHSLGFLIGSQGRIKELEWFARWQHFLTAWSEDN